MDWLTETDYAHRGLHGLSDLCPENSFPAIEEALDHGYGIEIDVQRSSDNEALVFHDLSLKRLTGKEGLLANKHSRDLKKVKYIGTKVQISTLKEVLAYIHGRVPLLIDIKTSPGIPGGLEMRVAELLRRYEGPVAVMSWAPATLELMSVLAPKVPGGRLVSKLTQQKAPDKMQRLRKMFTPSLGFNSSASRRFLSCDINGLLKQESPAAPADRSPLLTWTVGSVENARRARELADAIIFEGFKP